ncbi:NAD(P)-binding domain-containing protein [Klebsiella pneumoniae]|nr:NAD(P)-binding domain-containing protein [Klebsiella pneumoniae]
MNTNSYPVVIIGGGQAGLAMSWSLTQKNIRHIVLERHRLAWAWREQRWDNFCLVTPNWQCKLPGFPYDGDDPHGFMLRDDIVAYLERYARSFNAPLREGVNVQRVVKRDSRFTLFTSLGELQADQVVVAVGNYHRPRFPELAARLPERIVQIHSAHYKSAQQMPEGEVLVVGSAQSGAQIAEDLHLAGRQVHLCVGSAPRVARFYRGRDVVDWLEDMGHYRLTVEDHPQGEEARRKTNQLKTASMRGLPSRALMPRSKPATRRRGNPMGLLSRSIWRRSRPLSGRSASTPTSAGSRSRRSMRKAIRDISAVSRLRRASISLGCPGSGPGGRGVSKA